MKTKQTWNRVGWGWVCLGWMAMVIGMGARQVNGASLSTNRVTLEIKSDGSAMSRIEWTQPKALLVAQVQMWDAWNKQREKLKAMTEKGVDPDQAPAPVVVEESEAEVKPPTDAELVQRMKDFYAPKKAAVEEDDFDDVDLTRGQSLESVEVMGDLAKTVLTRNYTNLEALFSDTTWQPQALMGLWNQELELKQDSDGNLVLGQTSTNRMERRYRAQVEAQMARQPMIYEWSVIFPGKILKTSLDQHEGRRTWFRASTETPAELEGALKKWEVPLLIVAESGGLKVSEPVGTRRMMSQRMRHRAGMRDQGEPVVEGSPGYTFEATEVHWRKRVMFEGAKKNPALVEQLLGRSGGKPGLSVEFKVFAPKGRVLKEVSQMKVEEAKDDTGQSLVKESASKPSNDGEELDEMWSGQQWSSGGEMTQSMTVTAELAAPAKGAQSISGIRGSLVAMLYGDWKDMELEAPKAAQTNVVDLGALIPGATLKWTKVTERNQTVQLDAVLEGPASIRHVQIQPKLGEGDEEGQNGGQSSYDTSFEEKNGKATRKLMCHVYSFHRGEGKSGKIMDQLKVVARYPGVVRREQVKFKMEDIELP